MTHQLGHVPVADYLCCSPNSLHLSDAMVSAQPLHASPGHALFACGCRRLAVGGCKRNPHWNPPLRVAALASCPDGVGRETGSGSERQAGAGRTGLFSLAFSFHRSPSWWRFIGMRMLLLLHLLSSLLSPPVLPTRARSLPSLRPPSTCVPPPADVGFLGAAVQQRPLNALGMSVHSRSAGSAVCRIAQR